MSNSLYKNYPLFGAHYKTKLLPKGLYAYKINCKTGELLVFKGV